MPSLVGAGPRAEWRPPADLLEFGEEFLVELIADFVKATQHVLAEIAACYQRGQMSGIKAQAHRLKGSALQLEATGLAAICSEIETAAGANSEFDLVEALKRLEVECALVRRDMSVFTGAAIPRDGSPA